MNIEKALKLGIQHIGNNKYKEATAVLQDALNSFGKKEVVPKTTKKYTEKELYDLNKDEQVKKIKDLGGTLIPRFEKSRVEMILKLQEK